MASYIYPVDFQRPETAAKSQRPHRERLPTSVDLVGVGHLGADLCGIIHRAFTIYCVAQRPTSTELLTVASSSTI